MTTLGASLGFAMGAGLANPDKTVVNILGDAGIGMAGFDFETAVREGIPILSIVLNNGQFGGYRRTQPVATERYNINHCGGDYAKIADGLGLYSEKIDRPNEIIPAIERAKQVMATGQPACLEMITRTDTDFSLYNT